MKIMYFYKHIEGMVKMRKINFIGISVILFLAFIFLFLTSCKTVVNTTSKVTEDIPDENAFIAVEKEPSFDLDELAKNVIYPDDARKANVQGQVIVRVCIDKEGIPRKTIIQESDSKLLNQAAQDAVMKTHFKPAIQDKKPIGCWISIPIKFQLKK
jgi:TonB family protein